MSSSLEKNTAKTWLPILLGVIAGCIAFVYLGNLGFQPYERVWAWLLNVDEKWLNTKSIATLPKQTLAFRGIILSAILLVFSMVGGLIGMIFSTGLLKHKISSLAQILGMMVIVMIVSRYV